MRIDRALPALALLLWACGSPSSPVPGGDVARGAAAISRYGCGTCHTIGHLSGAHGLVGPPLTGIRNRLYVAGMLLNSAENLQRWIRNPKSINAGTAMPNLGVTPRDAADITAYLYTQ